MEELYPIEIPLSKSIKKQIEKMKKIDNTLEETAKEHFEETRTKDENDYYKVEDIEDTIFKKATSDKRIVYLMGNNIIADAGTGTQDEQEETEERLRQMDTKLLVPFIAAVIKLVNQTETQNN